MNWQRIIKHLFTTHGPVNRAFPDSTLKKITEAVQLCESQHHGEIRVAIEASLDLPLVLKGIHSRQRALDVFSHLRIWDTEANSGVLIYLLWADRQVEIIADRGVHGHVTDKGWESICQEIEKAFKEGQFETGILQGIERVSQELIKYFPRIGKEDKNELPNAPVML